MRISIKLFGPQAAAVGASEIAVEVNADTPTCAQVKRALAAAQPSLAPSLASCRLALNHVFAGEDQVVGPDDEVALIGLVSGG